MYWGASRDSVLRDQKGIGGIRGHWEAPGGCRGHLGVSGVYWGLAGTLGTQGVEGI